MKQAQLNRRQWRRKSVTCWQGMTSIIKVSIRVNADKDSKSLLIEPVIEKRLIELIWMLIQKLGLIQIMAQVMLMLMELRSLLTSKQIQQFRRQRWLDHQQWILKWKELIKLSQYTRQFHNLQNNNRNLHLVQGAIAKIRPICSHSIIAIKWLVVIILIVTM